MAKYITERVDRADSPNRCQAVNRWGQCLNKGTVEGGFCPIHGGNRAIEKEKADRQRLYQLTKYRSRLEELDAPNQQVKNLREEIGILRIVMENIVEMCDCPAEILAHSPKISDLATRIGKLVTQCHTIDQSLGQYMDKNDIVQVAQEFVQVISGVVTNAEDLDKIIDGIKDVMDRAFE